MRIASLVGIVVRRGTTSYADYVDGDRSSYKGGTIAGPGQTDRAACVGGSVTIPK